MGITANVQEKLAVLFPHLDERQRRLVAGADARAFGAWRDPGSGRAGGMREGTVSRGVAELEVGEDPLGRVRRPGAARASLRRSAPTSRRPRRVGRGHQAWH